MECLAQKAICLLDCIIAFCSAGLSHIFFILTDYSSKPLRTTPRTSRSCGPWRKTPALRHSWLSLMPNLLHWVQVPWHGLQLERHPGINACVSTPVLSTIHNWDQKGYIYIYIYGLYIYHSKKKISGHGASFSLWRSPWMASALRSSAARRGTPAYESIRQRKDLAGMTTCSYPASVLERNRSSSVRIWAISNLHRISSCTATQCAIHPFFLANFCYSRVSSRLQDQAHSVYAWQCTDKSHSGCSACSFTCSHTSTKSKNKFWILE